MICLPGLEDLNGNRENDRCQQACLNAALVHRARSTISKLLSSSLVCNREFPHRLGPSPNLISFKLNWGRQNVGRG
jgi:hypothetical protein